MVAGLDVTLDWSSGIDAGSWWMVGCECVIHQRVNYVLDRSHFRGYSQSARTNERTMSKTDNNNDYDYDQTSGEKHATHHPWTRGLSMKARPEVSLRSLGQRSEHEGWTRSLVTKSGSEVWAWGLDRVTDLTPGDCRKINSRAVPYSIQ